MKRWNKLPKWAKTVLLTALSLLLVLAIWVQQGCPVFTFSQAVRRLEQRHMVEEGRLLLRWDDTFALSRTDTHLRAMEVYDGSGWGWDGRGRMRSASLEDPVTVMFLPGLRDTNRLQLAGYTHLPAARIEAAITIGDWRDTAREVLLEKGAFLLDFSSMEQETRDTYEYAFFLLEQCSYMGLEYDGELPITVEVALYDTQNILLTQYQKHYPGR